MPETLLRVSFRKAGKEGFGERRRRNDAPIGPENKGSGHGKPAVIDCRLGRGRAREGLISRRQRKQSRSRDDVMSASRHCGARAG